MKRAPKAKRRRSRSETASEYFEAQLRNVPEDLQPVFRRRWFLLRKSKRKEPWEAFMEWAATDQGEFEIAEFRESTVPSDRTLAKAEAEAAGYSGDLPTLRKQLASLRKSLSADMKAVRAACKRDGDEARKVAHDLRVDAAKRKASTGPRCDSALEDGLSPTAARRVCNAARADLLTEIRRDSARASAELALARSACRVRVAGVLSEHAPQLVDTARQIEALERSRPAPRKPRRAPRRSPSTPF
ncbi:hypothetical protein [Polyangium fumosum]|uniref:Uncharacterized protein n=1 Tax=Polyangium fumosum TaxID=889272 RepID=A0A4U1J0B8_9BACT|nr:hypothetical protein [Polyangium fumosum]TKD00412.1 hypothetical protein E8A74_34525 [Polyangium fumosum]